VEDGLQQRNRRTGVMLALVAVGMLGFGFALVPLYDLYCEITGYNKIGESEVAQVGPGEVDRSRTVVVTFDQTINADLPWQVSAMQRRLSLHPGEIKEVIYRVQNRSNETVVGQAIPSVTPWQGTGYLHKMECFCFEQQPLAPGETKEMPLRFYVSADIPKDMGSLNLSYTFLRTKQTAAIEPQS
jgi:cytochrome c oxidase assembly protein subunit 11